MKKRYTTVFDASVRTLETVMVSAGRVGFQIELAPADLLRLADARTADLVTDG